MEKCQTEDCKNKTNAVYCGKCEKKREAEKKKKAPAKAGASAHTPGPWTVKRTKGEMPFRMVVTGANGYAVVDQSVSQNSDHDPIDRANMELIASAPEMLAALKHASAVLHATGLESQDELWDALERIDAVIAKAEGRLS